MLLENNQLQGGNSNFPYTAHFHVKCITSQLHTALSHWSFWSIFLYHFFIRNIVIQIFSAEQIIYLIIFNKKKKKIKNVTQSLVNGIHDFYGYFSIY